MKKITLEKVARSLEWHGASGDRRPGHRRPAKGAIDRMLAITAGGRSPDLHAPETRTRPYG